MGKKSTKMKHSNPEREKGTETANLIPDLPHSVNYLLLSFCSIHDLTQVFPLVCKSWNNFLKDPTLWHYLAVTTRRYFSSIPAPNDWKRYFIKGPFFRNLIKNPCGADGSLNGWTFKDKGNIEVESVNGRIPGTTSDERFAGTNFVTSYIQTKRFQRIDLIEEGFTDEMLDCCPPIEIGEWHACRHDCGTVFRLKVELLNKDEEVVDSFTTGEIMSPQWYGGTWDIIWRSVQNRFTNYGKGVRVIKFSDYGKDTQFWAGHYGAKMTKASVIVYPPN